MRVNKMILCSASLFVLTLTAQPAFAQPSQPVPETEEPNPDPAPEDQTLETEPLVEEGGEIVVTGIRRSIQSSQSIRRNSDQIVDAIVAEDIGKLPDLTASASLARITGVQVTRAAGEAADVQVRGLPDLSTTYNGREIFTAENRGVALQDFPAGGVAALEVYKSSTANLIEGGIAGQINVRSRRPFDFDDGITIFGSAGNTYFEQADQFGMNGNLLFSGRWETGAGEFGILLNGSYVETNFLDSTRENAFFIRDATIGGVRTFFPDTQAVFFGQAERYRPSVNGAIQWRPSPELTITLDGLFQGYRSNDYNRFRRFNLFGNPTFSNLVQGADGRSATSLTYSNAPDPFGFSEFADVSTDTYQFAGNIAWQSERLRLSADVAYTDSTFMRDQTNVDSILLGVGAVNAVFDSPNGTGGPTFDIGSYNILNAANYRFDGLFEFRSVAKGDDIQGRFDLDYDVGLGPVSNISAGVRYSDRQASRQQGGRFTFQGFRDLRFNNPALPFVIDVTDPGFGFDDVIGIRSVLSPNRDALRDNITAIRAFVGAPTTPPDFEPPASFEAEERSIAGYAQVKYEFDLGFPIDGVIGVRVVNSETSVTGTSRDIRPLVPGGPAVVTLVPVTRDSERTDYLPNISARLRFTDELQMRLAYTETRTLPRFDQLNPSATIDPPPSCQTNTDPSDDANCFRTGGGGNPNLRPLTSENYDLTLEYYFARAGSATLSLFRRDVNGFIANATVAFDDPEFGRLQFNAPDNGGDGKLQGVEAAVTAFADFEWLPEWMRGFGIQANYTYIDAAAELAPSLVNFDPDGGGPLPIMNLLPGAQPIPGVSEHSFNLVGIYESSIFGARLAYNQRSEYTEFYLRQPDPLPAGGRRDRVAPVMQESRGILDLSLSITPDEQFTFYFDATNLTGEPISTFRTWNDEGGVFSRARKYVERTYSIGARVRF